jgi:drug/metabolite transporter (DMT)-like permease
MKIIALFFTVLTGFSVASISIIVSQVAKDKISFFQFFAISNLLASVTAWLLFPNWALVSEVAWGKVLLITGSVGIVNTTLQAATVCSLKWGHNGLSVAIRNTSSMISMLFALIVLNEKISIINFCA